MERRTFLKASALGAAALAVPSGLASAKSAAAPVKKANSNQVNLGFIGLGRQCMSLLGSFIKIKDVRVVAGCDVYDIKRDRFEKKVVEYYTSLGEKKVKCDMYEDYQDLLARPDIDAVVIAVPDHSHAYIAIAACKAGKDVYLEKPMTLTIYEGQQLCKAVRKYNRVLQVGSQQRSSGEFIHAANICREGKLGKIQRVLVCAGRRPENPNNAGPVDCILPKQEVPAGLNWDKWIGPMSKPVYFSDDLDPSITPEEGEKVWGAWRWFKPTGGGFMTDWGAHMFDIAQWMLGKDLNGPCEIIPAGYEYYKELTFKYDNGIVMTEEDFGMGQSVKVYGEKGWLYVRRRHFDCSIPELAYNQKDEGGEYEAKASHHQNFIDCVRGRWDPVVPVEVGHSSCTVCNLGNIAIELGRPVKWNPIVQKFMDDPEADKLMHYEYRPGYSLDV